MTGVQTCALPILIGSFANVCVHRLPRGESVVAPRSRCPRCGAAVLGRDNLPVLSYALLHGCCRCCRAAISLRYPLVEALNGALYVAAALAFGPTSRALVVMGLLTALLVLGLIDFDHHLLPDAITRPGIAAGLVASLLPGAPGLLAAGTAAALGYTGCWAVASVARRVYGQEALGQGDWKMVAMLGAFLGGERMLLAVFLATLAGSVIGLVLVLLSRLGRRDPIPLGSFLALGGMVAALGGETLLDAYRGFWGGLVG